MGKILSFIGGCIAGVAGVFSVAVMSSSTTSSSTSSENETDEQDELLSSHEEGSVSGN
jgi:hypothetical protein